MSFARIARAQFIFAVTLLGVVVSAETTNEQILQAEKQFTDARRTGRSLPVEMRLDNASEIQPDGTVAEVGGSEPGVPYLASSIAGVQVHGDVGLLFGTANLSTGAAHYMHVWVLRDGKARPLVSQLVPLAPGVVQAGMNVLAGLENDGDEIDKELVESAERQRLEALRTEDHRALDRLLGHDFGGLDAGGLYLTRNSLLNSPRTYRRRRIDTKVIDIFGSVAIVRGAESGNDNRDPVGLGTQFVRVWVLRAGRLECVGETSTISHASPFGSRP